MTIKPSATLVGPAALIAVLAIACDFSFMVGCGGKPPAAEAEGEPAAKDYERGPHGGRLLQDGAFQAEVTIYERGVPPQFRVYLYSQGKPLPPAEAKLRIDLRRLGGRIDSIGFKPEGDYLVGDNIVEEPHSFDVVVDVERGGVKHAWKYSQAEGRVQLSDDAVRTSAIEVETAGPVEMRTSLELPGEIALNGDKVTHIVPRTAGVVREVRKNQGDTVRKGEVIAVIDSRELAEAKRHFIDAAFQLEFARKAFEREQRLFKEGISAEASYLSGERAHHEAGLKLRSARQQLEALGIGGPDLEALLDDPESDLTRYELRAPFDGVVIEKAVAAGQAVTEHEDLFRVADLSTVWVNVTVYAKDLNAVRVGQEVTVKSDALGAEARGKIVFVGSLVGGEARSAMARVVLPDPERRWRSGLFVTARVVQEVATVPVAVKREGLQKFRDWDVVFVRVGDHFEARPLELGRKDGDWVEVRAGLRAGEKYASANSFILKADVGKAGASHDH
ncbi:MAG TPA: efflux RND transporter periplasmic adaptor subunit [Vicinamibacteria bacterium]